MNEVILIHFKLILKNCLVKLFLLIRSIEYQKIFLIWLFIWKKELAIYESDTLIILHYLPGDIVL